MDSTALDAAKWLLSSAEPAARLLAQRDLLGQEEAAEARKILDGSMIRTLLSMQRRKVRRPSIPQMDRSTDVTPSS